MAQIDENSITIIGMGNGGHAFAAYAKSKGFTVKIWNRSESTIKAITKNDGIQTTGLLNGHFTVDLATCNIKKAINDSYLIMITTTANSHKELAKKMAPHLDAEQVVVLNPGRTGGALEVSKTIEKSDGPFRPNVIEAQSLLFVSRSPQPSEVTIAGIKKQVPVSAFPSRLNDEIIPPLQQLNKCFIETENVLNTSFDNIGAIFHPAPLLLNIARCEDKQVCYRHYIDGISPSVAKILENMDKERVAVAAEYGVNAIDLKSWLKLVYGSPGKSLFETIKNTKEYENVFAPDTLNVRYIFEDVPTGLVPIASFGEAAGIATPYTNLVIDLANCALDKDYRKIGRTIESLELDKIPPYLLQEYVTLGDEFYIDIMMRKSVIEQ